MLGDLTSLQNVADWLGLTTLPASNTPQYRLLTRMISQVSGEILNELQRPQLQSQVFTETKDGMDNRSIWLTNWPVTAVSQVVVAGRVIPPAPVLNGTPNGPGWLLDPWDGASAGQPQEIRLVGQNCPRGHRNVLASYTAGYLVAAEAQTVAGAQVTALAQSGPWTADGGVSYAGSGQALVAVSGSPAQGQYSVAGGVYTFNAADNGQSVLLSYSFTPGPVEDACINLVAYRYRMQSRIGVRSQAIGDGQSTTYDLSDLPAYINRVLLAYKRIVPIL